MKINSITNLPPMLQNWINILYESINSWIHSERQDKIISVQFFLIVLIFLTINLCYKRHKESIFNLKNFIEEGQQTNNKKKKN